MRDILFRGKRIDNGEWVEGHFYTQVYLPETIEEEWYWFIKPIGGKSWESFRVAPETVSQYTGLLDKNGKKIFEGDICQTKGKPLIDEKPFAVVWNDYYSGFYWENLDNPRETDMFTETVAELTEVIGNIHDNPELLEVGE